MCVIRVQAKASEQWNSYLATNRYQWGDHTDQRQGGLSIFNLHPWISPAVESPSVEIFKSHLDVVLGSLVWEVCVNRGWARGHLGLLSSPRPSVRLGKGAAFRNSHFRLVCFYIPKCHTSNAAFGIFLFLASNSSGHSLWIIKMCAKMCKALANYDVLINFSRQVWRFWWILIFF